MFQWVVVVIVDFEIVDWSTKNNVIEYKVDYCVDFVVDFDYIDCSDCCYNFDCCIADFENNSNWLIAKYIVVKTIIVIASQIMFL